MEKLLVGEKVEWKKLGEVCEFRRGQTITKKEVLEGEIPVVAGGQKPAYYHNKYNREGITISIAGSGAYAGFVSYWEQPIFLSDAFSVEPSNKLNIRFLYHWLLSKQMKIYSLKQGVGILHVYSRDLAKFKIPVPSLETQEKIVKILDNFTKYVTEVQAEVQARNKQYNYYRDMLLSEDYLNKISEKFTENQFIEWKMLGELFEFKNGLNKGKDFFGKGTPIINYMDVYKRNKIYSNDLIGLVETTEDEQKRYGIKRGDVFFTRTSETKEEIGKTSVLLDDVEKGVFSGFVLRARPITELLLPEYCAYCFETYEFRKNVIRYSTYTTRALTNGTTLSNLKIPVPSIEIQNKIVKILDRFQELLSDTKGLLPLEIEQRRKQYEYYREKLLTFDSICARTNERTNERTNITKQYLRLIDEAAEVAGIDVSDKVEWKTLGEICNIKTGKKPKEEIYETNKIAKYKYINAGTTETGYIFSFNHEKDTVTTPSRGQGGIGFVGFQSEKFWLGALCYGIKSKDEKILMNKYLYYYLLNSNQIILLKKEAGVPAINLNELSKIKVILPPLPVQEYIVSILDKFDALVNDLSQGLPKEIALRQKQYEYYREKLLNFEK